MSTVVKQLINIKRVIVTIASAGLNGAAATDYRAALVTLHQATHPK